MEKIIEKMDSYNIFNYLLPGAIFDYMFEILFHMKLVQGNIVENLFVYYFMVMILSRIGSIIIGPICKKIKWVKFADYGDFIKASEKDDMVKLLSEVNNTYRTLLSGGIVLIVFKIYFFIVEKLSISNDINKIIAIVFIVVLFALSYRKQTKYVANRVKKVNEEESK